MVCSHVTSRNMYVVNPWSSACRRSCCPTNRAAWSSHDEPHRWYDDTSKVLQAGFMLVLLLLNLLPLLRRILALKLRNLILPTLDIQSNRSPEDTLLACLLQSRNWFSLALVWPAVESVEFHRMLKNEFCIMRKLTSYAQNKILPYLR